MKKYKSNIEGLLMYSPAVFLHKDQIMMAKEDTVEIVLAVQQQKLSLIEPLAEPVSSNIVLETPEPVPAPQPQEGEQQEEDPEQEEEKEPEPEQEQETKKGRKNRRNS